jgi:phospholipid/cholesterol/gamma-HCH transport system substrate-binding protein
VIKQPPSRARLLLMVGFALSCFVIVLWLWRAFGGPVPLAPEGYRFTADFQEATSLADNADVRISGVRVGKVIDSELSGRSTRAEIEIDEPYAPIPRDTKAVLRQKTLLGETYVELSPGDPGSGSLPDGGKLPRGAVQPTVELDEVLRHLDAETRVELKRVVVGLARLSEGRGESFNHAVGHASPFARDAGGLLGVLDRERRALRRLTHDTGTVLGALGRRQGELSGLVDAGDRLLATTARRDRELRETVEILPVTLRELRPTFAEVEGLARDAGPVVRELRPAGRALGPALEDAARLAPELRALLLDVDRVTRLSEAALPAATETVGAAQPLFTRLRQTLRNTVPIVDYAGLMRHEVVAMVANIAASTQASDNGRHYLRALVPLTAEGFAIFPRRLGSNRHNPYLAPRGLDRLGQGLESIDCGHTGNLALAPLGAPPCRLQEPIEFRGRQTAYPQVSADP